MLWGLCFVRCCTDWDEIDSSNPTPTPLLVEIHARDIYNAAEEKMSPAISGANPEQQQQQRARTNAGMPLPPEPQQGQQRAPGRSRDRLTALCWVVLAVLLSAAGSVASYTWSPTPHDPPRFTVAALSISGGQVAFNVSNRNSHSGVSYKGDTRASLLFHEYYDVTVASGQANRGTAYITGVLDVVDQPSFNTTLRAGRGRLPLYLQLTTVISFRLLNNFLYLVRNMQVSCLLLVGADGRLLRQSVGAPCDTYFWPLNGDDG